MRNAAITAALITACTLLLSVTSDDDESADEPDCDPSSNTVVAYSETEHFVCHDMPMAVGQGENKGIWVRWICEEGVEYNAEMCRPAVDQEIHDSQSRELMDQLVFCSLLNGEDDPDDEYAPDYPTCNVYVAPLVFDGDNRHHYYQCYSSDTEKTCGYWHLQGCEEEDEDEEEFFDNTKQKCIKLRKKKKSFLDSFLRQAYAPYMPPMPFGMPMGNPFGMGMGMPTYGSSMYGPSLGPPVFGPPGWPGGPMPTDGYDGGGPTDGQGEEQGEGQGAPMPPGPPPMPPAHYAPPFAPPPFMQSGVPAPHRYRPGQLAPPLPFSMQDLNVYFMSMRPWTYADAPTRPPPKAPPGGGGGLGGFASGALSLLGKAAKAAGPLAFLG